MKLIFKSRKHEAGNVHSFYFISQESISWQAGQSIRLEIETDYLAEERRFTISSAPSEKHIAITTNLSKSPFKQALGKLKKGDEINGHNIEGNFLWPEGDEAPILLANGLGITPFRAQLAERVNTGQALRANLVYSYHADLAVFKAELEQWQRNHPKLNIQFIAGQKLTADLVAKMLPDFKKRLIYIAGSAKFINKISFDLTEEYKVKKPNIKVDSLISSVSV